MIPESNPPGTTIISPATCDRKFFPCLCWGAILGGTVGTIGIHILATLLGMAGGLAIFSPATDNDPVSHFSVGAALIWSVCALVALAFGGAIACRFSHSVHGGFVHGILVWSLTLIITVLLLSMGTGMVIGGAMKVVGAGFGVTIPAVTATAGSLIKEGAEQSKGQLASFIEEASQSVPTNSAPGAAIRSKRELGFGITKLFAPGNDIASKENRQAVISALSANGTMTEADANKTVDAWLASYNNLKTELNEAKVKAEAKAKELADQAAKNTACAAIWAFFALLIGLLVAAAAGQCGAHCALKHRDDVIVTVKSPPIV